MSKTPLAVVKEKFGDKSKLVEALKQLTTDDLWLNRTNTSKGLERVSNAKLHRLHTVFSAVKTQFGTRAKLIGAVIELEKRGKDEGYKARLETYPVPRLFDMWKSADKRAKSAKAVPAKPAAAPKKDAKAKKPPAEKKPAADKKPAAEKKPAKKA